MVAAITGIAINHTDQLGLARQELHAPWLLSAYGLPAPELRAAYGLNAVNALGTEQAQMWISQWDASLWHGTQRLAAPPMHALRGAAVVGGLLVIADSGQLLLFDAQGAPVDRLAYPAGFVAARFAANDTQLFVEAQDGRRLTADAALSALLPLTEQHPVQWQTQAELPQRLKDQLQSLAAPGVSVERLLLDVHSGRWMGRAGPWLMDLAALALLLLAATGVWTVAARMRRR